MIQIILVTWLSLGAFTWTFHWLESEPVTSPGILELLFFLLAGPFSLVSICK